MDQHELILLSPYRFPGQYLLTLSDEDMSSWLNGYAALWHPALLRQAKGPPRYETQYDHEQPRKNCVYVLAETPPLYLPDDWRERVRAAGSIVFQATPDRAATLDNLRQAVCAESNLGIGWKEGLETPNDELGYFFGLGLGYLLLASLAEAMEHENQLETQTFWKHVQEAVAEADKVTGRQGGNKIESGPLSPCLPVSLSPCLIQAAEKLLSAREVLYPVTVHLLDLYVLDSRNLAEPWPISLTLGNPLNVLAAGVTLQQLAKEQPRKLAELKERIQAEQAEVCGGLYQEREDILLPVDSQLWNIQKGQETARRILGCDIRVFGRQRFGFHPQLPLLLTSSGITRCLLLAFDETSGLPTFSATNVSWPTPDGKMVDAFTRNPQPVDSPHTFFNLGHYWFKTTREDHVATLAWMHRGKAPAVWYHDLMCLAQLAPVLGRWTTFSRYFDEASSGEHIPQPSPDDFHFDYLSERSDAHLPGLVSGFARHVRLRRQLDTCWTLAGLHRALAGARDTLRVTEPLLRIEDAIERDAPDSRNDKQDLETLEKSIAGALADRLLSRATGVEPGYLVLNPCGFTRRLALELEGAGPIPIEGPVKACQVDGNLLRVVVEVPALGFAWFPRTNPDSLAVLRNDKPPSRLKLADEATLTLRNEFFEADLDPQTGGLKGIRDHKTHVNRLGQRLVYHPGSKMVLREARVTSSGPALGEIVAEGSILDDRQEVVADFRQRYRVWLGRPVLELRIDIEPKAGEGEKGRRGEGEPITRMDDSGSPSPSLPFSPPSSSPWFAYFAARFAWRNDRGILLRGCGGSGYVTSHPRPQTPDYLEVRMGRQGTVIFPGGLPFHQRHEGRMLDVILMPAGEQTRTFDLAVALDREQPMQTAQGLVTPLVVVPTTKGPPHIGNSGWLFHLDSPHLLLSRLYPGSLEARKDKTTADAVTARFLECGGNSGQAEFRCVRNPVRAAVLNARGDFMLEAMVNGDAVMLEVTPHDLIQVQAEFS